jgi:hypothetical protein
MRSWFKIGSPVVLAMALLAGSAPAPPAMAQGEDPAFTLATRSAIVVLGTVTRVGASEEPLLAASASTVVITVRRMFAGSEFAGDQAGRTATVILSPQSRPGSLKAGSEAYFFGNPRFIGKTLTLADEGELPLAAGAGDALPPELDRGLQARRDIPVRARLAIAALVFRGKVESVRPLEGTADAVLPGAGRRPEDSQARVDGPSRDLRDEHDPDWQVALVRVTANLRGTENGAVVAVVFPASRDIVWFNVPKPKVGEEVLILGHRPQEEELPLLRSTGVLPFLEKQRAVLVTEPFDVLPPADEKRILALLPTTPTKGVQP